MTFLRIKMRKDRTIRLEIVPVNGVWHVRYKHSVEVLHSEPSDKAALAWVRARVQAGDPRFVL